MTLSPAFSSGVTEYTAATTNATNTITATAARAGATVKILVNGAEVRSGSAATWAAGENIVKITVTEAGQTQTYTVTVTKS